MIRGWIATAVGAVFGFTASPGSAQVTLSQASFEAGVNFAAFFKVESGCGLSPTTALRVEIPQDVAVLQLPEKPGWTIAADRDGSKVTAVMWRRGQAAADADQFGLLVKLPARLGPLYFPAVQRCGTQEIRWTDRPPAPVTRLAPMLTLIAAAPDGHANHSATILIERPWARATPPGAQTAAAYVTIVNHGAEGDVLIAASSPQADRVEFHVSTRDGGVMRMRPATSGITVPAHGTIELRPEGGYHVMLSGLKAPLRSGTILPVTLRFAKAGPIDVVFDVEPIGARGPSAGATPEHQHR
jgi:copper(I)-binding protein